MKSLFVFIWEVVKVVVIATAIVVPIRYFLFQPFLVKGQSMEPNFANGDYLIIDQLSYRFREPQRGEVVVFKYPQMPSQRYIKRILGLPGETVEVKEGKVVVSGFELKEYYLPSSVFTDEKGFERVALGENEYFVLGDNRPASSDSRVWGILPGENIIGRVFIRAWPFVVFAKVEAPEY
ncbi:MAG: signal peptidase I [Parcubacteria group bacterium Gr01-1014_30]|nr:MAG: signal peptidase I [Parcubacteria group bacterium Gr01-1014_30]